MRDATPDLMAPGSEVPTKGRAGRRAVWVFTDQALSSLSNVALSLVLIRTAAPDSFGAFSVAFAIYLFVLNMNRAISAEPLVVRFSASDQSDWHDGMRRASSMAIIFGLCSALFVGIGALFASGDVRTCLAALALCLPGMLLQDLLRYGFFAAARPRAAAANDLVWALVLIPMMAWYFTVDAGIGSAVLVWGGAANIAATFGLAQARFVPAWGGAPKWMTEQRDLAPRFAIEYLFDGGAYQLALFLIGAIGGLAALGTLRAAQVVLGPIYLVFQGAQGFAVPELVRLRRRDAGGLSRAVFKFASALVATAAVGGGLCLVLPDDMGRSLMGNAWAEVGPLLVPFTIFVACAGVIVATRAGLRSLESARNSLMARVLMAPLTAGFAALGAATDGARGAVVGLMSANLLGMVIWIVQFGKALGPRMHRPTSAVFEAR